MVGIWQFSQLLDVIFEWTTMFGKMSADGETDEVMVQLAKITGKWYFHFIQEKQDHHVKWH